MNFKPHLFDKWLLDKRLSNLERKIINGFKLLRNNQSKQIVAELSNTQQSDIPFVNAQKHLLSGIAYNNLSEFNKSETELLSAARIFEELNLDYYLFIAYFNQYLLYYNLLNIEKMSNILEKMRLINTDSLMLKARLLRCEFIFSNITEDDQRAYSWIEAISKMKEHLVESDKIAQLVAEFVFYVKVNDLKSAQATLNTSKQFRKFHLSENFNFMKKMLDNLLNDTPIYAYKKNFCNIPVLWHQLQVIHFLETGDIEQARLSWKHLYALAPSTYDVEFFFKGPQCLFSLCLAKHLKTESEPKKPLELNVEAGLVDKLIGILTKTPGSIPKGELYEVLWGEIAESKEDVDRLTRLVYKAKKRYNLDIISIKGSYLLKNKSELNVIKKIKKA